MTREFLFVYFTFIKIKHTFNVIFKLDKTHQSIPSIYKLLRFVNCILEIVSKAY